MIVKINKKLNKKSELYFSIYLCLNQIQLSQVLQSQRLHGMNRFVMKSLKLVFELAGKKKQDKQTLKNHWYFI